MAGKPTIAIVGAGNLGSALALPLKRAGYLIEIVANRQRAGYLQRARVKARTVGARAVGNIRRSTARVLWLCVPDAQIAETASALAKDLGDATALVALHSSGVLTSDELDALRMKGAAVASVHPLMTFVRGSRPALAGVPFAVEGDPPAVQVARQIVRDLGGQTHSIRKRDKAAYHAWGAFASPLFTSLLATTERVAGLAGVTPTSARRRMIPILLQTLVNYASFGAAGAFSGPIVRGDVETVKKHLDALREIPIARDVYAALTHSAVEYLPVKNKAALKKVLESVRH